MWKSIVLDAVVVAIIVISTIVSAKRGFVKSLISSAWLIISIVGGIILRPIFFAIYKSMGLLDKITAGISKEALNISQNMDVSDVDGLLAEMKIPENIQKKILEKIGDSSTMTLETFSGKVGETLGRFTVNAMAFLTGFAIVAIVIVMIMLISKAVLKMSPLGGVDRFFGALLGIVISWTVIYLICVAVFALAGAGHLKGFAEVIANSKITYFIYRFNPVTLLILR
ncbi:MAG: CvpA family protein [Clostridia bacterium]|nr:CvpA family protein [Clostridia bacterium]